MDIYSDQDLPLLEDQDNEFFSWIASESCQESQESQCLYSINPFSDQEKKHTSPVNSSSIDTLPTSADEPISQGPKECSEPSQTTEPAHPEFLPNTIKTVENQENPNPKPFINLDPINESLLAFINENQNYFDNTVKNKKYGKCLTNTMIKRLFNKRKDIFLIGILRAHKKMIKNAMHNVVSRNKAQLNYVNIQNVEQLKRFNMLRSFVMKDENYDTFWKLLQSNDPEVKENGKNKFNNAAFTSHFGSELLSKSFCMFVDVVFEEKNIELIRKRFKILKSSENGSDFGDGKWMSLVYEFLSNFMFMSSQ